MTLAQIDKAKMVWPSMAEALHMPHCEEDYEGLVVFLDSLIDEVGQNENHPLA